MIYLLDANIWLDAILGRQRADDVKTFLQRAIRGTLATTDYAVHSVGLYLYRDRSDQFLEFLDDLVRLSVNTLHLAPSNLRSVITRQYRLDFDDAFQYVAAERDDLPIVSHDADFERTPRGRLTAEQAIAQIATENKR